MRHKLYHFRNHFQQSLFVLYQKLNQRQKISKRITISFFAIAGCCLALFIINFLTVQSTFSSQDRLLKIRDYQQQLIDFTHNVKIAEIQTHQLERLYKSNLPLEDSDQESIHNTVIILQSSLAEMIPTISELSPQANLVEFQKASNQVIQSYTAWQSQKKLVLLDRALTSIKNIQFLSDDMLSTLTLRINNEIAIIQHQMNWILIVDIVVSLLILAIITILIFPLIREFKKLLNPLRQASDIALKGAANVLNHSSDVDVSSKQFKAVLGIMGQSIADVYQGAQYSSLQAKTIIISVKTASDLVTDLAEKATNIFVTLSNHQKDLSDKINQVQLLSNALEHSLEIISLNTRLAEQLNEQVRSISGSHVKDSQTSLTEIEKISSHILRDLHQTSLESQTLKQEFAELKQLLESLYSSNHETISASEVQLRSTEQIQLKTQQIMSSVENIIAQTEEVSASMQQLAASSEAINTQMDFINTKVSETHEVVEKQLILARLAKEATDRF